jgi:succinate dehydrogenase/fumarate reductase-like Fe-S protein
LLLTLEEAEEEQQPWQASHIISYSQCFHCLASLTVCPAPSPLQLQLAAAEEEQQWQASQIAEAEAARGAALLQVGICVW